MSTAVSSDTSQTSSTWQSYVSSSSESPSANRRSWLTSKIHLHDCCQAANRRSALSSLPVIPLSSEHSQLATKIPIRPTTSALAPEPTVTAPSLIDRICVENDCPCPPSIFLFAPPTVILPPPHPSTYSSPSSYSTMASEQSPNMADLVARLGSEEDAVRKMAVFKLQSLINDPAFAEAFIHEGGLGRLRYLILNGTGNTLAYGLASFARLLEVDWGWEGVDADVVQRVVELVVCHPLVNILRGAMAILVSVVSRPYHGERASLVPGVGGFQALKPAISLYPQFLEMLVSRLSSADHALCANALQLINSLMRDAIMNDSEAEWPRFIKRLQDLGVIKAVYVLMQSSALQDLAHPLLEFQTLTKVLLRRWRDIPVDLMKSEHRRTIKGIHLSSRPEMVTEIAVDDGEERPKHNPFKWRRLGFNTESPEPDFQDMGFLGMIDLSDFVRTHQDEFQQILLEQRDIPERKRCPIARASLIVTAVLYEHFEVEKMEWEDSKAYMVLESRTNFEKVFKPLLLHWSRLHVAGLRAYFRLWKATGAETSDFMRILELVRILFESVVGGAVRMKGIEEIEQELEGFEYRKLRDLQMELLELTYDDIWGEHLRQVKDELQAEALQFVKEQRVRCLLAGQWFAVQIGYRGPEHGPIRSSTLRKSTIGGYRFVRLSEDRKYLHYADFEDRRDTDPAMAELREKIDLSIVSSVVSNVTATDRDSIGSDSTLRELSQEKLTTTKITVHGYLPEPPGHRHNNSRHANHSRNTSKSSSRTMQKESVLLTIHPPSQTIASEWLDGLLMLLDQQPITAETNRLVNMISSYGLKVRLLNVRFSEDEMLCEVPPVPSRDGVGTGEDFYYQI